MQGRSEIMSCILRPLWDPDDMYLRISTCISSPTCRKPGSPIVVITHFFLATIKLYWQEELIPPFFAGGGGLGVCGFMAPSSPCSATYCIIILIQNDVVLFLGAVLISQLHSKHSHKTLQMPPLLWFTFNLWYNCLGLPL